jgi:hypothetical protein
MGFHYERTLSVVVRCGGDDEIEISELRGRGGRRIGHTTRTIC